MKGRTPKAGTNWISLPGRRVKNPATVIAVIEMQDGELLWQEDCAKG